MQTQLDDVIAKAEIIGASIRERREKRKITRAGIAQKIGADVDTLGVWENKGIPETVRKVAYAGVLLDMPPNELLLAGAPVSLEMAELATEDQQDVQAVVNLIQRIGTRYKGEPRFARMVRSMLEGVWKDQEGSINVERVEEAAGPVLTEADAAGIVSIAPIVQGVDTGAEKAADEGGKYGKRFNTPKSNKKSK